MDADTFRLILIVAGGLLLAGLFVWEWRRARNGEDELGEDENLDEDKLEPRLGGWHGDGDGDGHGETARDGNWNGSSLPHGPKPHMEPPASPPAAKAPEVPESPMILSLHLTPREGTFDGEAIVHAAGRCGIEPGEMDLFHRFSDDPQSSNRPLFSVANMVKPGTFPFGAMAEFTSPGLTLFFQAEGASDDPLRCDLMLSTARCLADELDAEVRHGTTRALLTPEVEEQLRDRVLELVVWRLSGTGGG
jgi:cell division protein ZipA